MKLRLQINLTFLLFAFSAFSQITITESGGWFETVYVF